MYNFSVFNNTEFGEVRVLQINDEPWFVGKDICSAFGDTNYRRSLLKIDDDEKGVSQIDTPGGKQNMIIVNESGLYSLLFTMEPQKANMDITLVEERVKKLKKFRRWVTSEVLPSVRKHGMYAIDDLLDNPDLLIRTATALKEEREQRKLVEQERDEAIRTKAYISDKKTATAMNTASQLSKENKKLKEEVGNSKKNRRACV